MHVDLGSQDLKSEDIIKGADERLYDAKRKGRNRLQFDF